MKTLKNRVAVVTGAASGIGRATSVALAEEGCDLAIVDVNQAGLTETRKLVEATGRRVTEHVVDVSDRGKMQKLPDDVVAAHGSVHVVVNNAGVSVTADVKDMDLDDFAWIVGINFWGVVYGSKFFLPHLLRADEGHVVNISSVFGLIGLPSQSAYAATKFAVRGFTESLRAELHGTNVGVSCVHPGGVNTNIVKTSRMSDNKRKQRVVEFFEKRTISPKRAAADIVHGILHNKARVLITREAYFIDGAKRLFPVLSNDLVAANRKRFDL